MAISDLCMHDFSEDEVVRKCVKCGKNEVSIIYSDVTVMGFKEHFEIIKQQQEEIDRLREEIRCLKGRS